MRRRFWPGPGNAAGKVAGERLPSQSSFSAQLHRAAHECGDLALLQLLRQRGCPWDDEGRWEGAVQAGCEAVLQWPIWPAAPCR